jgi:hypothetical protein
MTSRYASPPAGVPAVPNHDYAELSRAIRGAGLLNRRYGYYGVKISLNILATTGGWVAFAYLGNSTNHEDDDPDLDIQVLAFTEGQGHAKRGFLRWMARYQAVLFFPLLLLEGLSLHVSSVRSLYRQGLTTHKVEHGDPVQGPSVGLPAQAGVDLPQRARWSLGGFCPRRPELPDRAPPVPEHAAAEPVPGTTEPEYGRHR